MRTLLLVVLLVAGSLIGFEAIHSYAPALLGIANRNTCPTEVTTRNPGPPAASSASPMISGWFGTYLNNPHAPAPVGIASYGLYNFSNVLKPYVIVTTKVLATARIDALGAFNASLPPVYGYGANLQLNVMLEVNTTRGTQFFWLQNTNRFDTADGQVNSPRDLVFNNTGTMGGPILNLQGGKGSIQCQYGQTSYIYGPTLRKYALPLSLILATSVVTLPDRGVEVSFYNQPLGAGYFDNVTILVPNVTSAGIIVSPYLVPPNPVAFDAEFVWVAYCCDFGTTFSIMNSSLFLSYMTSDGKLMPFPSLYSFGAQTAERASNLEVIPTACGGRVTAGEPNNSFLENLSSPSCSELQP